MAISYSNLFPKPNFIFMFLIDILSTNSDFYEIIIDKLSMIKYSS